MPRASCAVICEADASLGPLNKKKSRGLNLQVHRNASYHKLA